MNEQIWVTHTCRICGRAFQDTDDIDSQNIPPTYRACEYCLKNGFQYEDKKAKTNYIKNDILYGYVFDNIPKHLEEHTAFILNKCIEILKQNIDRGKKISSKAILKQAVEVLGYYIEDNDYSFKNLELSEI